MSFSHSMSDHDWMDRRSPASGHRNSFTKVSRNLSFARVGVPKRVILLTSFSRQLTASLLACVQLFLAFR